MQKEKRLWQDSWSKVITGSTIYVEKSLLLRQPENTKYIHHVLKWSHSPAWLSLHWHTHTQVLYKHCWLQNLWNALWDCGWVICGPSALDLFFLADKNDIKFVVQVNFYYTVNRKFYVRKTLTVSWCGLIFSGWVSWWPTSASKIQETTMTYMAVRSLPRCQSWWITTRQRTASCRTRTAPLSSSNIPSTAPTPPQRGVCIITSQLCVHRSSPSRLMWPTVTGLSALAPPTLSG